MKKFKKQTSDQLHIFMKKKKTLVILVKCASHAHDAYCSIQWT